MVFYEVTNGHYRVGFYVIEKNAQNKVEEINNLIKKYKEEGIQGVDLREVYIVTHKTED